MVRAIGPCSVVGDGSTRQMHLAVPVDNGSHRRRKVADSARGQGWETRLNAGRAGRLPSSEIVAEARSPDGRLMKSDIH